MLETFKAQLKAKAKTLGVTNLANKRIDAYAATLEKQNPNLTTDDDHSEKVDAFLELIDIKEIAAYDDYKVSKAKNDGKKEEKKPEEKEEEKAPSDAPDWFKSYQQQMDEKLNGIIKEKAASSIKQKAAEKLKDVPEKFWNKRAMPDNEETLEDFISEIKNDYKDFHQGEVNKGLSTNPIPIWGEGRTDNVVSDIKEWAANKTQKTEPVK